MTLILDYSALGIATGGLYALIAIGIIVIFRASHTFNFAMGEMMTLAAYLFYTFAVIYSFGILAGLVAAAVGSVLVALFIERSVLRPMVGQPFIAIVMVTFGVGSILRGVISLIWGPEDRQVPALLARDPVMLGEIFIPGKSARAFAIAIILIVSLILYLRYSRAGIALRATAADQITSYSMGIDVRRVIQFSWVIAALTGCISGIMVANVNSLTPHMGFIVLNVLSVIILGGLNSIGGCLLAGLIIGWLEAMTGLFLGGEFREVTPYILVVLVLLVRPTGLFGTKEVERI